jgi:hypothetical protein
VRIAPRNFQDGRTYIFGKPVGELRRIREQHLGQARYPRGPVSSSLRAVACDEQMDVGVSKPKSKIEDP